MNIVKNKNKISSWTKIVLSVFIAFNIIVLVSPVYASSITESKLIELANQERTMRGLKSLTLDPTLYFAATNKASDMFSKNYFDHFSPDGKTPWDFIKKAGYHYSSAGENLAMDFRTSEGVTKAWMSSSTHRENILDEDFQDIAIATKTGEFDGHETTIIVEMFGKKNQNTSPITKLINSVTSFIMGL